MTLTVIDTRALSTLRGGEAVDAYDQGARSVASYLMDTLVGELNAAGLHHPQDDQQAEVELVLWNAIYKANVHRA